MSVMMGIAKIRGLIEKIRSASSKRFINTLARRRNRRNRGRGPTAISVLKKGVILVEFYRGYPHRRRGSRTIWDGSRRESFGIDSGKDPGSRRAIRWRRRSGSDVGLGAWRLGKRFGNNGRRESWDGITSTV
jgi:hypothetical protein